MHEMSLAMSTVDLVVETATRQGLTKVTGVWLEVGRLSCVEADTIAFCFEAAARATPAEGARLHIEHKGAEAWCYECHARSAGVFSCGSPRATACASPT